jgi:hypothetical protein
VESGVERDDSSSGVNCKNGCYIRHLTFNKPKIQIPLYKANLKPKPVRASIPEFRPSLKVLLTSAMESEIALLSGTAGALIHGCVACLEMSIEEI